MIIDQLPLLGGDVDSNDEIPIERGTTSYKTTKAALVKSAADAAAAAQTAADNAQTTADNVGASLATYVRPNLLDNWYFVGGGPQLGYGIFPINQRGQSTYSGSGYTIDRWTRESGDASTVELLSSGLKITRNSGTWCLRQNIKSLASLSGKTVTFSALIADTNSAEFAINLNTYDGSSYESKYSTPATAGQTSLISVTTKLRGGLTDARCILVNNGAVGTYATVIAAKLEIGDTQTLAHQENGVWVLNEIPDYATELAKCQAYYIKTSAVSEYSCSLGLDGSNPRITIPLPVTMAKAPTFTKSGADGFQFGVGTTRVSVGGSSDSIQISGNYGTVLFPNAVRLTLQTTASIGTAFLPCTVEIPVFELSAE